MTQPALDPEELSLWQAKIRIANQHNIFCHCQQCQREWVASAAEPCSCGSQLVETIACWQFPDD
ncbi:MAG: hypothetical protein HC921_16885 [Synechococcaceae cyanobacterium SM2_3_1]|nr:hypothetical protein [Synechococcaceae cyanobacterium SM2_3_1]